MSAASAVSSNLYSLAVPLKDIKDNSQYVVSREVLIARLNNPKLDPEDRELLKEYLSAKNNTKDRAHAKVSISARLFLLMNERIMKVSDKVGLKKVSDSTDALLFAIESCGIKKMDILNENVVKVAYLPYIEIKAPEIFEFISKYTGKISESDFMTLYDGLSKFLVETITQLNETTDDEQKIALEKRAFAISCLFESLGGEIRYPISKYVQTIMPGLKEAQYSGLARYWGVLETPEKYDDQLAENALREYMINTHNMIAKKEKNYNNALQNQEYAYLRTFAIKTMNLGFVISKGQNIAPNKAFYSEMVHIAYSSLSSAEAGLYVNYYVDRASGNTEKSSKELSQIKSIYSTVQGKGTSKSLMIEELSEVLKVPLK
jgi:hypothetical protein